MNAGRVGILAKDVIAKSKETIKRQKNLFMINVFRNTYRCQNYEFHFIKQNIYINEPRMCLNDSLDQSNTPDV